MKNYWVLLSLLKEQKGRYLAGLLLMAIARPLSNIVVAYLFMEVFNKAVYNADVIVQIMAKFFFLAVILTIITPLGMYLVNYAALKTTASLRERTLRKIIQMDQTVMTGSHSGDLISRTTNDIQTAETAYKEQLIGVSETLLNGLGCTAFMFILNWRFAFGLIVFKLIMLFIISRFSRYLKKASDAVQFSLGKLTEKISDILAGYQVIRLFNIGEFMVEKFREQNDITLAKSEQRVKISAAFQGINKFINLSSFVGFVAISVWFMTAGYIELGIIVALVQLQMGVSHLFDYLGIFITRLQTSMAGFERIDELLAQKEEPKYYPSCKEGRYDNTVLGLYNINFHYEDRVQVINNLNFIVNKGETVAIVGPSGGGKSTLLKLILGFYFPQSGCLTVMGKPASCYTIHDIRDLIAYVPQDPYLFNGSVYNNISCGNEGAAEEKIIEAARQANAHEFIINLDEGYQTMVGERGTFLSGGQKQRIAIARAIIKDAEILLLDEATSALDNESETLVQATLDNLMKDKTSVVIAHRLSTIKRAHRILVIDQGAIVEQGTQEELLELDGIYANLYSSDFKSKGVPHHGNLNLTTSSELG